MREKQERTGSLFEDAFSCTLTQMKALQYEVKPMPYLFCEGCMFNGCYPWNKNPALLCSYLGGIFPTVLVVDKDDVAHECANFKLVTEKIWQDHLQDLKSEAKLNEKCRIKAIDGKVFSNHPLPAKSIGT